ncbi:Mitochondrial chaperone BCS1 [Mycena kentingensis (nom. inval.)]|nr:Mitochondrial chaperone BCS1 [Mycena kentingensis (nom. inval.)]
MAEAFLPLVQQVLSTLGGAANATAASASTDNNTLPPGGITSISSLLTFLLSFSALRDWFKLAVLGSVLELLRRFVFGGYHSVLNSFWVSASFAEEDVSYHWMLVWLSKQPSWRYVRDVQVSTNSSAASAVLLEADAAEDGQYKSARQLAYLPSLSASYNLWYKRRWMKVTRVQTTTGWGGSKEQTLYISILTRDHKILSQLLLEARKHYIEAQEHKIGVYVADSSNNWRYVASRDKRPLDSIVLDPGVKELLVDDAKEFLSSKAWYNQRAIPYRRGYLLYGAPGSGKSSWIHALAGHLGLDIYIISLSRVGLDDSALNELINALPERCCALMEDIDAAFTSGITREIAAPPPEADKAAGATANPAAPAQSPSRLSLSGLLNALDGVGAQEGRILFATTNKYDALDPALCRPGRLDLHLEFKLASRVQAKKLFCRFYLPTYDPDALVDEGEDDPDTDSGDDSGYNSTDEGGVAAAEKVAAAVAVAGKGRPGAPQLTRKQIIALAERFSRAVPERELSMAALQGYLMTCKVRPVEAAVNVGTWIEKERKERLEREKS